MKTQDHSLIGLLSERDVTFFIPPYQRNYEWDDNQCDVFFEDIRKTARLAKERGKAEHFFGIFVYVPSQTGMFWEPNRLILVDGQQRLTTTMIFLMALRDELPDGERWDRMRASIDSKYIHNDDPNDPDSYKVKLKQVETDWRAFKAIALTPDEIQDEDKKKPVVRNYRRFRRAINALDESERADLIQYGLSNFNIVAIELDPTNPCENPQEIFESLNSLGKPLSLADLVRNWLLMGEDVATQERLYMGNYVPMEKWLGTGETGRMSDFIRDFMQYDMAAPLNKATPRNYKSLYATFKKHFDGDDASELLPKMKKYAEYYAAIAIGNVGTGNAAIDRLLADMRTIGSTTAYSLILAIIISWKDGRLTDAQATGCLRNLFIYFMRKTIMQSTGGVNKFMPTIVKRMGKIEGAQDPALALMEIFDSQKSYVLRLPGNDELTAQLRSMNMYSFAYTKFLLSLVEERLTNVRPDINNKKIQIEHIMPQTLDDTWRKSLGPNADAIHDELVHTLGNLTLVAHNQELGNKSFSYKKRDYKRAESFQIARRMITECNNWGRRTIEARADWLARYIANNVLPVPPSVRSATPSGKKPAYVSFAAMGLVGKTISYADDPSITAVVIDDTRVSFEDRAWKLSPLTAEIKRRRGQLNASGAYAGPNYWTYDGKRIRDLADTGAYFGDDAQDDDEDDTDDDADDCADDADGYNGDGYTDDEYDGGTDGDADMGKRATGEREGGARAPLATPMASGSFAAGSDDATGTAPDGIATDGGASAPGTATPPEPHTETLDEVMNSLWDFLDDDTVAQEDAATPTNSAAQAPATTPRPAPSKAAAKAEAAPAAPMGIPIEHTLDEDPGSFGHTKPTAVTFMGQRKEVRSWRQMMAATADCLWDLDPGILKECMALPQLARRRNQLISETGENMIAPHMLGDRELFVETHYGVKNTLLVIKALLDHYDDAAHGIGLADDFSFTVREIET